jgi:copper chaperone
MGLFGSKQNESTALIKIEGMSCGHCVMRVEKGVTALVGVKKVKVDLAKKEGAVTYDPSQITEDAIKAKITEIGYPAS